MEGRRTDESCLADFLETADLRTFSALSSARRIFLPSSSLSASSCWVYYSTVFHPNSDLSANKISFYLSFSIDVPSDNEALAFSTALFSRCDLASPNESWSFELNLYWISFPLRLNDFGSSRRNFLIYLIRLLISSFHARTFNILSRICY